jgi:hypothetical protein
MGKGDFEKQKRTTEQFLKNKGIGKHMVYGPVDDLYWKQPVKILMINEEAYGYDYQIVDKKCLWEWVTDAGKTKSKTAKTTVAFAAMLLKALEQGAVPSPSNVQSVRRDLKLLESTLDRICYYNIKSTSNDRKPEDKLGIIACGSNEISGYIKNEILALDANLIFVSGKPGTVAFAKMFGLEKLRYLGTASMGGARVQSLRHMSRANYTEYAAAIKTAMAAIGK